jgi:hypothetical protein
MYVFLSEYDDSSSCSVVSYRQFMGQHWSHRDRQDTLLHAYVLDGGYSAFVEAVAGECDYRPTGTVSSSTCRRRDAGRGGGTRRNSVG